MQQPMSVPHSSEQQEMVVSDRNFADNIAISDYSQYFRSGASGAKAETSKPSEGCGYQTVYTGYQTAVESASVMTTTAIPVISLPASYQQMTPTTATSAGQFEHITVMTSLQQPPNMCGEVAASSVPNGLPYTSLSTTNSGAFQICPPSAITQQVQQSVPALSALPSTRMQNRPEFAVQRAQTSRSTNCGPKATIPTMLPLIARGTNKQLANLSVVSDDGPTVRQHLQQQHMVRLQQQLALQEKMKTDKEEFGGEFSGMSSVLMNKTLPVSEAVNLTTSRQSNVLAYKSAPTYPLTSSSGTLHASPSMNISVSPQVQRQFAAGRSTQKQRAVTDRITEMQSLDSRLDQAMLLSPMQKQQTQLSSDAHDEAAQRSADVYSHITTQTYSAFPGANSEQVRNAFPRPSATTVAEVSAEAFRKRSLMRRRSHQGMTASQVRVTMLGTQSEPTTQKIITESDHVLPIHGVACRTRQSSVEVANTSPEKNDDFVNGERIQPLPFLHTTHSAVSINPSQTIGECLRSEIAADPPNAQKPFVVPVSGNSLALPERSGEPVGVEHVPAATGLTLNTAASSSNSALAVTHGNASQVTESSREATAHVQAVAPHPPVALVQPYSRKLYFMKRMTRSLKNAALCDEVSRLNQRIKVVQEERKFLAKRLQHHERNRIRRIQTKLKKAAAEAAKANESHTTSSSVTSGAEGEGLPAGENDESDDSDKTLSSSGAATPNTSASMSRVETPEPGTRNQEVISRQTLHSLSARDGGKCRSVNGLRRLHSAKRNRADRKEKNCSN